MTMKQVRMVCRGNRPLMLHNVQLASPMNAYAKELKRLNGKRVKVDEDRTAIARVEFEGGLYLNESDGPYIPGANVLASLIEGAKVKRAGKKVERGVLIQSFECPLIYDGPRDVEGLWGGGTSKYVDIRPVTVQTSKVDRCRPIFHEWKIEVDLIVDETALDYTEFVEITQLAGKMAGLGDYRRVYGRYDVTLSEL
jgi:hypothetical protein